MIMGNMVLITGDMAFTMGNTVVIMVGNIVESLWAIWLSKRPKIRQFNDRVN